jgi:hypothetical protein
LPSAAFKERRASPWHRFVDDDRDRTLHELHSVFSNSRRAAILTLDRTKAPAVRRRGFDQVL